MNQVLRRLACFVMIASVRYQVCILYGYLWENSIENLTHTGFDEDAELHDDVERHAKEYYSDDWHM